MCAKKRTGGSSKNGRDSNPKYLGVKLFGGHKAQPGAIIVRQKGTKFHPGYGVGIGRDHTIFAVREGIVNFKKKSQIQSRTVISIIPSPLE
jgi:large subunit ribosomal protein L27